LRARSPATESHPHQRLRSAPSRAGSLARPRHPVPRQTLHTPGPGPDRAQVPCREVSHQTGSARDLAATERLGIGSEGRRHLREGQRRSADGRAGFPWSPISQSFAQRCGQKRTPCGDIADRRARSEGNRCENDVGITDACPWIRGNSTDIRQTHGSATLPPGYHGIPSARLRCRWRALLFSPSRRR